MYEFVEIGHVWGPLGSFRGPLGSFGTLWEALGTLWKLSDLVVRSGFPLDALGPHGTLWGHVGRFGTSMYASCPHGMLYKPFVTL